MPDSPLVLAEQRETVLVLTLNRPERMNAWTDALEDQYFERLAAAEADPAVRAIVVTGAGRGFPPLTSHMLPTSNSFASGVS
jgi:enoyl-CoA hydratase/carnithine racemase